MRSKMTASLLVLILSMFLMQAGPTFSSINTTDRTHLTNESLSAERTFEFTYQVTVDVPSSGSTFSVHVPMPQDSPWQTVRSVQLQGPVKPEIYYDAQHGNRILRYEFHELHGQTKTLQQTYTVHRTERSLRTKAVASSEKRDKTYYQQFLNHHQYMKTNQEIKSIAEEATEDAQSYEEKLRALYDRVREMMTYDKSGRGWGRGDIRYCLKVGQGNCTDFHTLFSSLAREADIPSRFLMGFPIPRSKNEGVIGGYHCWVESYVPNQGWFPLDISEGDKHRGLGDFYFGTLDADRILFTRGKNIPLSTGRKVNYLVYPVIDGNENAEVGKSFRFRNL